MKLDILYFFVRLIQACIKVALIIFWVVLFIIFKFIGGLLGPSVGHPTVVFKNFPKR